MTLYDGLSNFLPLAMAVVVIYFAALRPQQQKIKQQQDMLSKLKAGDWVVTAGGLIGNIDRIADNEVFLAISDGVISRIRKNQIIEILPDSPASVKKMPLKVVKSPKVKNASTK